MEALSQLFLHPCPDMALRRGEQKLTAPELGVLALAALVLVTICSKCSPLYPFNDWVDANTYFTVGKSALRGMVPYRDLVDQKGPLLFALHTLAALVSFDTFFGVYLLELPVCFCFLLWEYKLLRLFFNRWVLWVVPILGLLTYASYEFAHGDSAEEFCLPLLAYGLYVGTKALTEDTLPTDREFLAIGITSGCVLWMKYNMLGFYLGWFLVLLWAAVRDGALPRLLRGLGWIALGVFLTALPFLVYYGVHGAIGDWFRVYFYDNLVTYPKMTRTGANQGPLGNLLRAISTKRVSWLWSLTGLAFCAGTKKGRLVWFSALTTLLLVFGVYIGGWFIRYYRLIFWAVYPFGFAFFYQIPDALVRLVRDRPGEAPRRRKKGKRGRKGKPAAQSAPAQSAPALPIAAAAAAVALSGVLALRMSSNVYLMDYDRSQLPQYQAKAVMDASGIDHPTLLNYGFLDGGFYTVADIVPQCRYFCYLNVGLPEIMEEQDRYIAEGRADFVITRNRTPDFPGYQEVGAWDFWFEGYVWDYHLYQNMASERSAP